MILTSFYDHKFLWNIAKDFEFMYTGLLTKGKMAFKGNQL